MLFKLYFIQKIYLVFRIYIYKLCIIKYYTFVNSTISSIRMMAYSSSLSRDVMQFACTIYLLDNIRNKESRLIFVRQKLAKTSQSADTV